MTSVAATGFQAEGNSMISASSVATARLTATTMPISVTGDRSRTSTAAAQPGAMQRKSNDAVARTVVGAPKAMMSGVSTQRTAAAEKRARDRESAFTCVGSRAPTPCINRRGVASLTLRPTLTPRKYTSPLARKRKSFSVPCRVINSSTLSLRERGN